MFQSCLVTQLLPQGDLPQVLPFFLFQSCPRWALSRSQHAGVGMAGKTSPFFQEMWLFASLATKMWVPSLNTLSGGHRGWNQCTGVAEWLYRYHFLCDLCAFPLVWATISAVSCDRISCLMIFWLNFPRDTQPSPAGREPGKLSTGKTKSCEMLRKNCIGGSFQTGKGILCGNSSLA